MNLAMGDSVMAQNEERVSDKRIGNLSQLGVLLLGILVGQAILYGACLTGREILLPLDTLASPRVLLPKSTETERINSEIKNPFLSDLLFVFEPQRRFAVSELRAGRLPMWAPYGFAGAPFLWPKFSPFLAVQACVKSPVVLAWAQLFAAGVGSVGAYVFFRRSLAVSFWPGTLCAWCYPLTGFFMFWQGYPTGYAVYWLPWLLLAIDSTVGGRTGYGPAWLSGLTFLVLVSGHLDVAAQVLLCSGFYGLWCLYDTYRGELFQRAFNRAVIFLAAGWLAGFLFAAPQLLPSLEYSRTGARIALRQTGKEERPPVGIAALPLAVLPDMYGRMERGNIFLRKGNQSESAAAAYSGLVATVLVAPIAWASRRHRSANVFWTFAWILGLSWCLNLPGFVQLLRLPGLNMMSHNRLVFLTCFATLGLSAIGLEVLFHHTASFDWRRWWVMPCVVLVLLLWCCYRAFSPPEPLATQLDQAVFQGRRVWWWISDIQGLQQARSSFCEAYAIGALLCTLALSGWISLLSAATKHLCLAPAIGTALLGDLVWFAHGRSVQCDPALYYPRIPVLEQVARSAPGRFMGYRCLPANLGAMYGLRDVRGYDGVDPARLVELIEAAAEPEDEYDYARTMWAAPKVTYSKEGQIKVSPLLDMLGVRYIVFRGSPKPGVRSAFQQDDYWVAVNDTALPRVFVPRRVEIAENHDVRLKKLTSTEFNPRDIAYTESPVTFPGPAHGFAEILSESPIRLKVGLKMETPGLVVLSDLWDPGWRAFWNEHPVPILRTNHALRGVAVPAGNAVLEFRYWPRTFVLGLWLSGLGFIGLSVWLGILAWSRYSTPQPSP